MDRWQAELAEAFTDARELLSFLEIEPNGVDGAAAALNFPVRVTRSFAGRMKKGDLQDPLLQQVLPSPKELTAAAGFMPDPVGDRRASVCRGLLRKYSGRVLLIITGACAINCRYCFRRNFPYRDQQLIRSAESAVLRYIASEPAVEEVILSGGDPLVFGDQQIGRLIASLADVPHLRRIRLHSRVPVVLPSRVTDGLVAALRVTRLSPVMVIHANHPNEWNTEVQEALQRLRRAGVTLLNQAVLLRGINDDAGTLAALSERLFGAGVLPYYLHMLDRASGTAHFEVSEPQALALHEQLRRRLPGYLVPRLVREEAGQPYKTLL